MEESEKSPVLDRLVQFMNSTGLSSSQFADTTGIPRPSLSQMLHGRNKSVNNQVLFHPMADVWRGRDGDAAEY